MTWWGMIVLPMLTVRRAVLQTGLVSVTRARGLVLGARVEYPCTDTTTTIEVFQCDDVENGAIIEINRNIISLL